MFNVGDGVKQRMRELNDFSIHDSIFVNVGKIATEYGFGSKFDYLARLTPSGPWEIEHYPANVVVPEPTPIVIDKRGQLPTRAGASPYPVRQQSAISLYTIHYTAGPPTQTVEQVAIYQVGPSAQLPFPAIAYHLFIDGAGKVYWCHDFNKRTWGSDGSYQGKHVNDIAVHACYAGNVQPNPKQLEGIKNGLVFANQQLARSLTIRGHKDDDATACPGPHWPQWKP